ncbi:MAG TPA: hypothetical protein VFI54_19145 [Solirubrobacteraceae bacterium]|nr:hypothetical protein [Solirubrobacteraceae bacterium]
MTTDDEAVRYRQATHLALDQLQWCVAYLRTIRKTKISDQVAKNRTALMRRVREIDGDAGHERGVTEPRSG